MSLHRITWHFRPFLPWKRVPEGLYCIVQYRQKIGANICGKERWGALYWDGSQMVLVRKWNLHSARLPETIHDFLSTWHRREVQPHQVALEIFEQGWPDLSMHEKIHIQSCLLQAQS